MKFDRILKEESLNFIAVDHFKKFVVERASVFFLTHYHADHLEGLCTKDKAREVGRIFKENPDKVFYCSDITKRIFESDRGTKCFIPESQIISKPIGEPFNIFGPKKSDREFNGVTVTFIPSGHILGAIMILFEHENECCLFTGDFRIHPEDVPKIKALHDCNGDKKKITHLYLDTTFGSELYPSFPLRSEVSKFVARIVSDWLAISSKRKVHLHIPYNFAYESLIIDVSNHINCKIMVNSNVYEKYYKYIPDIRSAVFPAPDVSEINSDMKYRIHVSTLKREIFKKIKINKRNILKNCKFCQYDYYNDIQLIFPSARYYKKDLKERDYKVSFSKCRSTAMIYVPYSTHCSLEELQAFVKYINPKEITTICDDDDGGDDFKNNILSLISKNENSLTSYDTQPSQVYEINESYYSKSKDNDYGLDSPPQ